MAIALKAVGANLTTTLTTSLLTAGAAEVIRITHIIVSCGSTAGTVTLSFFDSSANATYELLNARAIAANGILEVFDLVLEPNDQLRGGVATASNPRISIFYASDT